MASYQVPGADGCTSWKTASDLSSYQYHVVQLSAAKTAGVGVANGDLTIGILMNKPTSGQAARVFTQAGGICKVVAGDAIAVVGSPLCAETTTADLIIASDNDIIIGYALETAGAAGDVIEMLMISPYHCADVSYFTTGA